MEAVVRLLTKFCGIEWQAAQSGSKSDGRANAR
jgi:hypothetical protein